VCAAAAIEAGISRAALIIIVSTAAMRTPLPCWVKTGGRGSKDARPV
jgi:hypothetical protein